MTAARMSELRTSLIGAMLVAIGPISMALYTPAMPELVHAFNTTEPMIKLTLSLYFGGFAVAQLVAGTLSDAYGRRKVTIGFMVIYLIGSAMAAFAPTVEVLLGGRLIQGVGAAAGMTVSRAIVRDQFTGNKAAGIMNLIGMLLAVGPAFSPTIGAVMLGLFGWQSIFLIMVGFACAACIVTYTAMAETTIPDPQMLRPGPILLAYREVLGDIRFVAATLVIGGAVGALYTQATVLPFVLIDKVGLTPAQFGAGMLMQSGAYFLGSIVFRFASKKFSASQLVVPGLVMIGSGSVSIALSIHFVELSYLSIMLPVGISAFGIAFVSPHMMTAAVAPFPHIAGTASALMGFVQMGSGLVGGIICAVIGLPVLAMGTVVPAFGVICLVSYFVYTAAVRTKPLPEGRTLEEFNAAADRQAAE
jgi:DHA1 family bicyclomycin/chloramphenicol resistance-like MFS transporter